MVSGVSWKPYYDLRAHTSDGDYLPDATLLFGADIVQETGELWDDAQITLSTSDALQDLSVPALEPLTLSTRRRVSRPSSWAYRGAPVDGMYHLPARHRTSNVPHGFGHDVLDGPGGLFAHVHPRSVTPVQPRLHSSVPTIHDFDARDEEAQLIHDTQSRHAPSFDDLDEPGGFAPALSTVSPPHLSSPLPKGCNAGDAEAQDNVMAGATVDSEHGPAYPVISYFEPLCDRHETPTPPMEHPPLPDTVPPEPQHHPAPVHRPLWASAGDEDHHPNNTPPQTIVLPQEMLEPHSHEVPPSLLYHVPHKMTLPSCTAQQKVAVASVDLSMEVKYVCVPHKAASAFMEATITNTSEVVLINAPITVYVDDRLAAKTHTSFEVSLRVVTLKGDQVAHVRLYSPCA